MSFGFNSHCPASPGIKIILASQSGEFIVAEYDYFSLTQFESVDDCYDLCKTDSEELVWRDGSYNWTPIRDVLKKFGDM